MATSKLRGASVTKTLGNREQIRHLGGRVDTEPILGFGISFVLKKN